MLDKEFINRKINLIREDLGKLEYLRGLTIDQVAGDWLKYSALKNILMEIIGRGIDINEHFILELMKKAEIEAPRNYRETFLVLGKLKVLPEEFAVQIARSAGFRNAIVHDYNEIDRYIIYRKVDDIIEEYGNYCGYILDFLKKNKRSIC